MADRLPDVRMGIAMWRSPDETLFEVLERTQSGAPPARRP
jgi:hypothetical protein